LVDHPDMAAQMGRRAQQRYSDLFTAKKMSSSYLRLYREILGSVDN
jgi:rhamnosyl/mannosyltransferase